MDFQLHLKIIKKYKLVRKQYYDIKLHKNCFFYHKKIDLRMHVIYVHWFNNRAYVGQAVMANTETPVQAMMRRWKVHCYDAFKYKQPYKFAKMIRENNISWQDKRVQHEIITLSTGEDVNNDEQYWIELYDAYYHGFNETKGGGGVFGYERSIEVCSNLCKSVVSYDKNDNYNVYESIQQAHMLTGANTSHISQCCQRKCNFVQAKIWRYTCENLSKEQLKIEFLEAQDKLINYKILHKRRCSNEHKLKLSKKINQYDLQGNFIKTYDSIKQASQTTGICESNISACAKRHPQHKRAGKFIWRYFGDIL